MFKVPTEGRSFRSLSVKALIVSISVTFLCGSLCDGVTRPMLSWQVFLLSAGSGWDPFEVEVE